MAWILVCAALKTHEWEGKTIHNESGRRSSQAISRVFGILDFYETTADKKYRGENRAISNVIFLRIGKALAANVSLLAVNYEH